jgi:hypothetical protein
MKGYGFSKGYFLWAHIGHLNPVDLIVKN